MKAMIAFSCILAVMVLMPVQGLAHAITNVVTTPPSPASLVHLDRVDVTFDFVTEHVGNTNIFVRPMSGGVLASSYNASSSSVQTESTGSGTGWFTLSGGITTVDQIRFQIWDWNNTTMIYEQFEDVSFSFGFVLNETETFGRIKLLYR